MKEADKKAKNNLYVKNIPVDWTEDKLREEFGKFGNISSVRWVKHANGIYAFICYLDPERKSYQYGVDASLKAVEAMHGKMLSDKPLYVQYALSSIQRKIEVMKKIINLKQSKKRCNLLVRSFPETWLEEEIKKVFEPFGKIENVRLLYTKTTNVPHTAFVCYEHPSEASEAKLHL